jgi:hypothetical protein
MVMLETPGFAIVTVEHSHRKTRGFGLDFCEDSREPLGKLSCWKSQKIQVRPYESGSLSNPG